MALLHHPSVEGDFPFCRLADALGARFATKLTSVWIELFRGGSSAIVPLGSLAGNLDAGLQFESGGEIDIRNATYRAIRHDCHPMGRWVDLVAPNAVRPDNGAVVIPGPAPKPGGHTRTVLLALGYSEPEIAAMIVSGAAGETWSTNYLPE